MAQQWPLGSAGAWTRSGSIFHSLNYWAITVAAFHCSGRWRITRLISLVKLYFFNRAYLHSSWAVKPITGMLGTRWTHILDGVATHCKTPCTQAFAHSHFPPKIRICQGLPCTYTLYDAFFFNRLYFMWPMFFSIIIFRAQGVDLQKCLMWMHDALQIIFLKALNVAYKNWTCI